MKKHGQTPDESCIQPERGPIRSVLFLSPEAPYPLHGGGQYRTASLIHYFAEFADVDLILISEAGKAALLPPKSDGSPLVRTQTVIPLPAHGKGKVERYLRNARRALVGVPPLVDRLSGLSKQVRRAIGDKRYDIGIVEHFWLAPYVDEIRGACAQLALDLHNVESMLHHTCAMAGSGLAAAGHRRFAEVTKRLEADLLPRFSIILATSPEDKARAQLIAPEARIVVYPNALPDDPGRRPDAATASRLHEFDAPSVVVFSGNFEYHPNIDAVRFLVSEIWPLVRKRMPHLRLRLVGRGDSFVREFLREGMNIEATGPLSDAFSEIRAADLVVAPLRMGSGTRIKILEAWAAARPVVATPLAAEGLAAADGENIALAASPAAFADVIVNLLGDRAARHRLACGGRRTFERQYTWQAVWRELDHNLGNLGLTQHSEARRYTGLD